MTTEGVRDGVPGRTKDTKDTPDEALATVTRLIQDLLEPDDVLDIEITMDTSFADDLEMQSVAFVVLSERLHEHYGASVNFVSWIAGMEMQQIMDLTVGQLVRHISA